MTRVTTYIPEYQLALINMLHSKSLSVKTPDILSICEQCIETLSCASFAKNLGDFDDQV